MRLDFENFVITGPSTNTASVGLQIFGVTAAAGKEYNNAGACLTDVFTVSSSNVPPICGTVTGEHGEFL